MTGAHVNDTSDPLLENFLSGDHSRVMEAVWEVTRTRDPQLLDGPAAALSRIRAATDAMELGGMLISNGSNLEHALSRLDLFRRGRCLCEAYDKMEEYSSPFYDVKKEATRGHVEIIGSIPVKGWEPILVCECTGCGRQFQVEYGEYHYPWWKWDEVVAQRRDGDGELIVSPAPTGKRLRKLREEARLRIARRSS